MNVERNEWPRRLRDGGDGGGEDTHFGRLLDQVDPGSPTGGETERAWARWNRRPTPRSPLPWALGATAVLGAVLAAVFLRPVVSPEPAPESHLAPGPIAPPVQSTGDPRPPLTSTSRADEVTEVDPREIVAAKREDDVRSAPSPRERAPREASAATIPSDFERATRLARAGEHDAALALYDDVARGDDVRADLALYEVGRIRFRQLADLPGAMEAFERYRTRFPEGSLRQEVDLTVIDILLAQRRDSAASSEIEVFLQRYPQSERRDALLLQWGDLLREAGDCSGAIATYEQVAGAGATADDAAWFAAVCASDVAGPEQVRRRLDDYLDRFDAGRHREAAQRARDSLTTQEE